MLVNVKKIIAKILNTPLIIEHGTCETFIFDNLYDKTIYEEPDGSKWIRICHHNNPASNLFAASDNFAEGVYKNEDVWYCMENVCSSMNHYEFMVKQKDTATSTETKQRWVQSVDPSGATYAQIQASNITINTSSGYDTSSHDGFSIYANVNSAAGSTRMHASTTVDSWWGAAGAWTAYEGGIPGMPNRVCTTGYMDVYIRFEPQYINYWKYRKWTDGTAECWYSNIYSIPKMNAEGSVFWYASPFYKYPNNLFLDTPTVHVTCGSGNSLLLWSSLRTNTNTTLNWYFTGDTNGARPTVLYNIYAVGHWGDYDDKTNMMYAPMFSQEQMTQAEIRALIEGSGHIFRSNDNWDPTNLQ